MPKRLKSLCRHKTCNATHRNANGLCDKHQTQASNWGKWSATKGNTTQRGYGREWELIKKQIKQRDNNLCQPCERTGRLTEAHAVDHIKPKSQGGTNAPSNLECICKACHKAKTAMESRGGAG